MTTNYSIQKGSMLIDLIIALFLGSLFIAIIANNTHISRNLYERANTRLSHITLYEANATSLLKAVQNQVLVIGTTTNIYSKYYGNDFYINTLKFGSGTTSLDNFVSIRSKIEASAIPVSSTALCSADYFNGTTVGSYDRYFVAKVFQFYDMFERIIVSICKIYLSID